MILIADSGSTKTSWVLSEKNQIILEFTSAGFNPYIQSAELISQTIRDEVFEKVKDYKIEAVYFYGAGCSTKKNKAMMLDSFRMYFTNSNIEIEHDLLAAARALWFNGDGIVGILGTGSNSCLYKAGQITSSVPSLGFILGDEGSGAYIGKTLVRDYLYNKMPEEVNNLFKKAYSLDAAAILENVYKKENPNRWLSRFAVFASENIHGHYCQNMVLKSIRDFFDAHLIQYPHYQKIPLGVVGAIGYYFKEQLEIVSGEYGFSLKKVIKSPIDELVKYHLQHGDKQ